MTDQSRGGKAKTIESGVNIPFIASLPGTIPAGRVSETLVDFTDIIPTCADLAQQPVPGQDKVDGASIAPYLRVYPRVCHAPNGEKTVESACIPSRWGVAFATYWVPQGQPCCRGRDGSECLSFHKEWPKRIHIGSSNPGRSTLWKQQQ